MTTEAQGVAKSGEPGTLYKTVEDRDTVAKMQWSEGWAESLGRLAEWLP